MRNAWYKKIIIIKPKGCKRKESKKEGMCEENEHFMVLGKKKKIILST